ncbi:hypothetical protein U9M48_037309 [Paspalum notatum var. saurae]|uniref:Uncharacterized protein n=1 Tax=Paspalum notatum var. saurae TaxID=547442 RepID=A0AAQ3UFC7_PASNO
MDLAVGAMVNLAPKLGELLKQEYVLQKGLKPDIESLSNELLMMKAALVDASEVPPDQLSNVDKLWVRQVRELSYDIEDTVDDFMVRVAGRDDRPAAATDAANVIRKIAGKVTAVMKKVNVIKKVKDRHQLADKIKDIKKLSKELAELRARYTVRGAGANLAASIGIDPRVLGLYKKESDLVGVQEARNRVIRMLTETNPHADPSDQSVNIVSIVGVGGLGKTTLAKMVYDTLKQDFDCSAFFSVGRTPNVTRIFEKLLVELNGKYKQLDMARWDLKQFCDELHTFLHNKRYFIVVDDIWDNESWKIIRDFLKDNDCRGSRIIMTTRNFDVTTKEEKVYRLKPLSDDNSKKLFYKRVQSQEGKRIDHISIEASSKIIDKCGGIPLAIIAMASLLADKSCQDWAKVYDSIGFGKNDDSTMSILSYSYYDLPSYLKPCLLYLSIFSEDDILDPYELIWMWMAEGFVHIEKEGHRLFEVGERYFNELVNRSMIQMENHGTRDLYKACRIHDIVLELIRKLSIEENFVTILGKEHGTSLDSSWEGEKQVDMPCLDSKARRVTIQNCHVKHIPQGIMDRPETLRSVCIIFSDIENMPPLCSFRVCRVLFVYESRIPINLKHLWKLQHLKFLAVVGELVEEFSKEVGQLRSLQRLELWHSGLEELPPSICSLTQLLCLKLKGQLKSLPAGRDRMGNLASLEHLELNIDGRSATEAFVVELGKLTRLRVLVIKFGPVMILEESLQKSFVQSLCSLRGLQELEISFVHASSYRFGSIWELWEPPRKLRHLRIDGFRFSRCPAWISSSRLPCLRRLDLLLYLVQVHDLDSLSRFPELDHLNLDGFSWPPMYTVCTDGFKNLRTCAVKTLLKFDMGAMPNLEELHFQVSAEYLAYVVSDDGSLVEQLFPKKDATIGDLDFGLGNLRSLEQVTIKVSCYNATPAQVQETEAAVRRVVEDHPNRPTLKMEQSLEGYIVSDQRYLEKVRQQHNMVFPVSVREIKDDQADSAFIWRLRGHLYLQRAIFSIDCAGASMCQVEKVEAAIRHAANDHHNRPTLQLIRINTKEMASSSDHPNTEVYDHDDDSPCDFFPKYG